ncbi:hypothetical protein [Neobacillus niacini]|nr:hypothetical protein [Neobacillus niacini]MDR7002438.1 hypothetical protein [Neobacillus niacini]
MRLKDNGGRSCGLTAGWRNRRMPLTVKNLLNNQNSKADNRYCQPFSYL